jgi:TonB-dependent receptor
VGTVSTDLGQRFGVKKQFGILVDGSYDYNGRGIDNIQPSIDPYSTFAQPFYDNNTIREYRYYRYRDGFSGSADYKLSENTGIYAHGFYSDLKDWGDKWYYEPQSTALAATGELPSTSDSSPKPKFYTSSKRPNASVGTLILGGRHTGSDSWITWETSASRSYEVDSAGNPKADFAWVGPTLYCNYNPMAQQDWYRPRFGTCDGPNSPLENATDWTFKDITISKGLVSNLDLTAATSYARNYQTHGHFGVFEAGFKFSNGHQTQDSTETVYDGWSTSASAGVPMTALQSGFENHDYYNGSFLGGHYGPVSNFNEVQNYTLANFSSYVDGYSTASDTYPNIFHTIERITAFYGMNDIDLGKLHVQTGLRFEETQMDTFGYLVTLYGAGSIQCGGPTNTGCGVPTGVANNPSYLDVLPSVQFRYKVTPDSAIRAVFARGVARPDPYQLVPYVTEDDSSEPATVDIGNPSLRPEHANNYDLLYENYLHPLGMIQAGVFFKQLTSPQIPYIIPAGVTLSALPANVLPPSLLSVLESYQYQGQSDSVTEYINGGNAYIYGFEASYQQHLNYLPGVLGGLGILANYSLTSSQIKDVPLRTDHPRLIDQAVNTWNVSPTYDTKRLSVRMGIAFNGANLNSYNWISSTLAPGAGTDPSGLGPKGPSGDIVTLAHLQVDAQASYRFWHGMSAVVSGLNLTNEVFGYYEGSIQFVNQLEYYKPTYSFGLRYSFDHEK